MNYYFIEHETNLIIDYFIKSINFYSNILNISSLITSLLPKPDIKKITEESIKTEIEVSLNNDKVDNIFLYVVLTMNIILLLCIIIPLIIGFINIKEINLLYILINFIIHIIFIVGFELLLFYIIIPYLNPVKLHTIVNLFVESE